MLLFQSLLQLTFLRRNRNTYSKAQKPSKSPIVDSVSTPNSLRDKFLSVLGTEGSNFSSPDAVLAAKITHSSSAYFLWVLKEKHKQDRETPGYGARSADFTKNSSLIEIQSRWAMTMYGFMWGSYHKCPLLAISSSIAFRRNNRLLCLRI